MIEPRNVTQHYEIRPVPRKVNLRVKRGELVAVFGPDGMGKSTLLGVIGGVISPQSGGVVIDGMVRRHSVEDELEIRGRAVFLPDRPWLPANGTGREFALGAGRLYFTAPRNSR
jgi:ABC-type multidrug transport system ATPase subunit